MSIVEASVMDVEIIYNFVRSVTIPSLKIRFYLISKNDNRHATFAGKMYVCN